MNFIAALKLRNLDAPSALDALCAQETIEEIFEAMTPQQLFVALCLTENWTLRDIANELSDNERYQGHYDITWQAIACRRRQAQERVARTMYHRNAEHLVGDVMARRFVAKERRDRSVPVCLDCGRPIHRRSKRCESCAQTERRRREREEAA